MAFSNQVVDVTVWYIMTTARDYTLRHGTTEGLILEM